MSDPATQPPTEPSRFQPLAKGGPIVFVIALMGLGWFAVHQFNAGGSESDQQEAATDDVAAADTLTLPEGKLKAAGFETVPAQSRSLQNYHTIPGRIGYDETKHIEVKAPLDAIVTELRVTPGQAVQGGQLLAVLRSPEIGQARAEILKRRAQQQIAQQVLERETTVAKNLLRLSSMLDQDRSVDAIDDSLADLALGSYRQEIMTAYANLQLSAELLDNIAPLANSGAVTGRAIRERRAERQLAEAAFRTARDQATFAAEQARLNAEADLAEADRQLSLAYQAVETLLGYKQDPQSVALDNESSLSRLEVRAPFAGTIESRSFANNERVSRGDSLVVLANTDTLYVSANIRESDWSAVGIQPGTIVSVTVPALDDRRFEARIHYVGRQVQTDTNSVPLIATIDNREGLLRPGMFVRVTVPIGEARQTLSVKPESVVQHENQEFVFVDMNGGTFQRVNVSTGQAVEDWVEVTEGLSDGQLIVTHGAFLLKSELLLQGEAD
ncbi:efflux RND transporter periplasmic adaptor subunit [Rosistilla oblonga]|uniref:efflux RND transporter periplasmic adaptor subunit n=1 Tax=Rosistilla oblonga TaxID=2527990 RepID=UPI003A97D6A8